MRNISKESFVATNVVMAFEDGSVSFCIPQGATFADISDNLDKLASGMASSCRSMCALTRPTRAGSAVPPTIR